MAQQNRISIVVLNYLNYKDTVECVDSIIKHNYSIDGVVVVDNGSHNNSYTELINKYGKKAGVHVIRSRKNLGFAKGNNLGIAYARNKFKSDFVLVVNNDTVFIDENYIDVIVGHYKKGIGCIGSKILLRDGSEQGEYASYIAAIDVFFQLINAHSKKHGSSFDFPISRYGMTNYLHGSALLFTPDFFKHYKGFYSKTFLYYEEPILYYMCKCKDLSQLYVTDTCILHKEDQSSLMSFNNDDEIIQNYAYESKKYVLWWAVKWELKKLFTGGK